MTDALAVALPRVPDAPLRLAREGAVMDERARAQAIFNLPEARGLQPLAIALAGTNVTVPEARTVLRAAGGRSHRPGAR